ncbi:MAG: zinc ribbon domain-containing protein [Thermodesulfobacteriota bacterium]
MPIYEFYCGQCNVLFNFYSSRINTTSRPDCPRCGRKELERRMSTFATIGKATEEGDDPLGGMDESKMEQAFESLMKDAEGLNEDDPRQMATLMRKFSDKTGINLGDPMEEAISRMEQGEDPEQVEREMGDLLEGDDAFSFEGLKKAAGKKQRPPIQDDKLYDL